MPTALITGITGNDGAILAEKLLNLGYEVHGLIRRSSNFNTARIEHLYTDPQEISKLKLHYGDICDGASICKVLTVAQPDEVYHLAAQSHVRVSFDTAEYTADVVALGTLRILEAIRDLKLNCKFYNASSSEIFGASPPPQNERTKFHPRSPYGAAKAFAYHITQHYREAYGFFAVSGILFNHLYLHQSPTFITRKVSKAVARIKLGLQDKLYLGNLSAKRDLGWGPEYVEQMINMLKQANPTDFVIGTGETHSIEELVECAFSRLDLEWQKYVEIDPRYYRATEVDVLQADASKAKKELGWNPKVLFHEIVNRMVDNDFSLASKKCE